MSTQAIKEGSIQKSGYYQPEEGKDKLPITVPKLQLNTDTKIEFNASNTNQDNSESQKVNSQATNILNTGSPIMKRAASQRVLSYRDRKEFDRENKKEERVLTSAVFLHKEDCNSNLEKSNEGFVDRKKSFSSFFLNKNPLTLHKKYGEANDPKIDDDTIEKNSKEPLDKTPKIKPLAAKEDSKINTDVVCDALAQAEFKTMLFTHKLHFATYLENVFEEQITATLISASRCFLDVLKQFHLDTSISFSEFIKQLPKIYFRRFTSESFLHLGICNRLKEAYEILSIQDANYDFSFLRQLSAISNPKDFFRFYEKLNKSDIKIIKLIFGKDSSATSNEVQSIIKKGESNIKFYKNIFLDHLSEYEKTWYFTIGQCCELEKHRNELKQKELDQSYFKKAVDQFSLIPPREICNAFNGFLSEIPKESDTNSNCIPSFFVINGKQLDWPTFAINNVTDLIAWVIEILQKELGLDSSKFLSPLKQAEMMNSQQVSTEEIRDLIEFATSLIKPHFETWKQVKSNTIQKNSDLNKDFICMKDHSNLHVEFLIWINSNHQHVWANINQDATLSYVVKNVVEAYLEHKNCEIAIKHIPTFAFLRCLNINSFGVAATSLKTHFFPNFMDCHGPVPFKLIFDKEFKLFCLDFAPQSTQFTFTQIRKCSIAKLEDAKTFKYTPMDNFEGHLQYLVDHSGSIMTVKFHCESITCDNKSIPISEKIEGYKYGTRIVSSNDKRKSRSQY